jgi:hypothetical protein
VGEGLPEEVMVAVKVTFCPETEGFWEEVTLVLVPVALTTWVILSWVSTVLALKLASPL